MIIMVHFHRFYLMLKGEYSSFILPPYFKLTRMLTVSVIVNLHSLVY